MTDMTLASVLNWGQAPLELGVCSHWSEVARPQCQSACGQLLNVVLSQTHPRVAMQWKQVMGLCCKRTLGLQCNGNKAWACDANAP